MRIAVKHGFPCYWDSSLQLMHIAVADCSCCEYICLVAGICSIFVLTGAVYRIFLLLYSYDYVSKDQAFKTGMYKKLLDFTANASEH